jgi:single-strand DNA-binding protein
MNYNKAIIGGRLTRDPELMYTTKGTAITGFSIAVTRTWKSESGEKKEQTSFLDCVAFGGRGETISKHFKKGEPIFISGYLEQQTWDDKQTGQKRSKVVIQVEEFQFVGSKRSDSAPAQRATQPASAPDDPMPEGVDPSVPF